MLNSNVHTSAKEEWTYELGKATIGMVVGVAVYSQSMIVAMDI
jgi:hypothetical protein